MEALLNKLKRYAIKIGVFNDQLKLEIPEQLDTAEIEAEVREHKQQLISYLKQLRDNTAYAAGDLEWFDPIERKTGGPYEVSHQVKKEYLRQLVVGKYFYNLNFYLQFERLDKTALEKAIFKVLERHESLRTCFRMTDGKICHHVYETVPPGFKIDHIDLKEANNKDEIVMKLYRQSSRILFDFETGPLVAFQVVDYSQDMQGLLVTLHHIISDATSIEILRKEITVLYEAFKSGSGCPLPPLKAQYKDYSLWTNRFLEGEKGREAQRFYYKKISESIAGDRAGGSGSYRQKLENELRTVLKREDIAEYADCFGTLVNIHQPPGRSYTTFISGPMLERVQRLATECNSTLFVILIAALQLLLHSAGRGRNNIRIYIPFSTRVFEEFEQIIGWLTGEVIICMEIDTKCTIRDFAIRISDAIAEASRYRLYPYERMLNDLDVSLSTLAPVFFNYIKAPDSTVSDPTPVYNKFGSGHFDLGCTVTEHSNCLSLSTNYNTDVYSTRVIEHMFHQYMFLLDALAKNPQYLLSSFV